MRAEDLGTLQCAELLGSTGLKPHKPNSKIWEEAQIGYTQAAATWHRRSWQVRLEAMSAAG